MARTFPERISFILYLIERFFFRVFEFIRRWYIGAGHFFWRKTSERLQSIDRTLALKITIVYFFRPLYGDESILGRLLGLIFRTGRILIALIVYSVIILFVGFLYLLWALFPIFIISKIFLS